MIEIIFVATIIGSLFLYTHSLFREYRLENKERNFAKKYSKILQDATEKSQELIKETETIKERFKERTNHLTAEVFKKAEKDFLTLSQDITKSLVASSSELLITKTENLKKTILSMEEDLLKQKAELYQKSLEQIESYKKEKTKEIDATVAQVVDSVAKQALSQALNRSNHESLIYESLNQFLEKYGTTS